MTSVAPVYASASPLWRAAQVIGLALTLALLAALVVSPDASLRVLWYMVIPVLPAVFLINPLIWRNVCPLATLNAEVGRRAAARVVQGQVLRYAWLVGIALLVVLVPARRFLFNVNGPALAITVSAVAVLALAAGFVFSRRAGFCNTICPVLPVEKLYGQTPLARVGSARCSTCNLCTPVGCIDLAGEKTTAQTLGPWRKDSAWLFTGFGAFATAFPGFVVGYFTTKDTAFASALGVYATVALWSLGSYIVLASIAALLRIRANVAMPVFGALAFLLYYWLAAPAVSAAFGGATAGAYAIRAAAMLLLLIWAARTISPRTAEPRRETPRALHQTARGIANRSAARS
jgi:nitrite reductase (NADH) large subunit